MPPREDRPSFDALGGAAPDPSGPANQMVQHPPLAYWLDALVLRLPGVGTLAWDLQVWLLRLLGIVLVLPVPFLAWAATRRLLLAEVRPPRPPRSPFGAPRWSRSPSPTSCGSRPP